MRRKHIIANPAFCCHIGDIARHCFRVHTRCVPHIRIAIGICIRAGNIIEKFVSVFDRRHVICPPHRDFHSFHFSSAWDLYFCGQLPTAPPSDIEIGFQFFDLLLLPSFILFNFVEMVFRQAFESSKHQERRTARRGVEPLYNACLDIRHRLPLNCGINCHDCTAVIRRIREIFLIARHELNLLISHSSFSCNPDLQPLTGNSVRHITHLIVFVRVEHLRLNIRERTGCNGIRKRRSVDNRHDNRRRQSCQLFFHPLKNVLLPLLACQKPDVSLIQFLVP